MVIGNYQRTYENAKGLVDIQIIESDMSGVNVKVLVRHNDERPDKAWAFQPICTFDEAILMSDPVYHKEVNEL